MEKENPLYTYGVYAALGFEVAGATIAGVVVGYFLDSRLGTTPWCTLIGAIGGLVGAVYRLIVVLQRRSTRRDSND
jgi:F0F1-type ATP synthase assembly protein I